MWLAVIKSKCLQWLAVAGAVLAGMAFYGAKQRHAGKTSMREEIVTRTRQVRDEFEKIDTAVHGSSPFERLRHKRDDSR